MLQSKHAQQDESERADTICNNQGVYKGTFDPSEETTGKDVPYNVDCLDDGDIDKVLQELLTMFESDHTCWPSDAGHYGPFMIRLAWHASGTYRIADKAGGAGGGRIRFEPESIWADNANLDKARSLLAPIKANNSWISWADLFVLSGTAAIHHMGGPGNHFCFGRIDDNNGDASDQLNCDPEFNATNQLVRCDSFGGEFAFGQDQSGLIYVNAQGPNGDPNPYKSAQDIQRTFGRMGMNHAETVALVGGGHAFGQCHALAGEGGTTKTSGFEGSWTNTPTKWSNDYFRSLVDNEWETTSTRSFVEDRLGRTWTNSNYGGTATQWQTINNQSEFKNTMMLTADIALKAHTDYSPKARTFSRNPFDLSLGFAAAWQKLTENGGGWVDHKRCIQFSDYNAFSA